MKLLYIFSCCVLVLYLGPVGNAAPSEPDGLVPDDPIQITVTPRSDSPVDKCIAAGQTTTMNVRLWKFTSKSKSTFVRRLVSDDFVACFDGSGQQLPATDFMACSTDTDNAGLKMFKFMDGVCTGYPFSITLEQQSCLGSGPHVFYTKLENIATARRRSETGRSPAFREQATSRTLTVSTDVIVDVDGYKGIAGKGLSSNQAYRSFNVMNKCQCQYFCNSDSTCKAYSLLNLGTNSFLCSLANQNVYTNRPSSVSGSYYAVKRDLVEPHDIDNLIYKRLATVAQGFGNHKTACEAIPGYRLVAVKFQEQMPILLRICLGREPGPTEDCPYRDPPDWFYVDMVKLVGVPMIQGVLILYETNVVSVVMNDATYVDHFIYAHSRMLHDENALTWNTRPVCQANVYGVNW